MLALSTRSPGTVAGWAEGQWMKHTAGIGRMVKQILPTVLHTAISERLNMGLVSLMSPLRQKVNATTSGQTMHEQAAPTVRNAMTVNNESDRPDIPM